MATGHPCKLDRGRTRDGWLAAGGWEGLVTQSRSRRDELRQPPGPFLTILLGHPALQSERPTARGPFPAPCSRRRARGMMLWSLCFPRAPASGAALAAPPQPLPEKQRGRKGGGLERLVGGRRGGGEVRRKGGGNISPSQCLRLFSPRGRRLGFTLHTLSQFLAPFSAHPPSLPP